MSERTTRPRSRADIAADMDEADRLAGLARDAARVADSLQTAAIASLATFYAVRATWTHIPTDKED